MLGNKDYSGVYLDNWENYIEALEEADIIVFDGGEPLQQNNTKILQILIDKGMTNKQLNVYKWYC